VDNYPYLYYGKIIIMEKRNLGSTGLSVAPLALGGNVFGWTIDEAASFKILDAFVDAGLDLIDTADVYSKWKPGNKGGESETIIGNWLKQSGKRNKVIIATKVGTEMAPDKKGLSKKYILSAVEASLKRLQTDHIDLYQSHYDDPNAPQEETAEAYFQLIKEGKVGAIGASNITPERLTKALEITEQNGFPSYQTLQPLYNLYDREGYEKDFAPICKAHEISVIPYYSLASGFLTGKYRTEDDLSKSQRGQGVKKYMNERGMRILKALDEVAKNHNTQQASVALAWLMTRPNLAAPIASATSIEQLKALIDATHLKLDDASIEKLNEASAY
jgi:aryl-alcohol dehydrogenase-like predicted oxidoreductase